MTMMMMKMMMLMKMMMMLIDDDYDDDYDDENDDDYDYDFASGRVIASCIVFWLCNFQEELFPLCRYLMQGCKIFPILSVIFGK